ncbi:hypothetical protein M23134_03917 [Microscilla marina ATCC 23134]|uniref:Uncharacterized protein n=1 Tax=Microscilla marina ATCC 23134 TaxID=313606 RepID=A1ZMI5_MICM2|nr:hypothetical protein M23134_03917 [Microscilla marina ATCC 23134]
MHKRVVPFRQYIRIPKRLLQKKKNKKKTDSLAIFLFLFFVF